MFSTICNEIKNRLNIDIINNSDDNKYLTFNIIKNYCSISSILTTYCISSTLKKNVLNIILNEYSTLSIKKRSNKFDQLMFIPILLYNHLLYTSDEDRMKNTFDIGYQLSKDLLTSVMSTRTLYSVKKLLLKYEIIQLSSYKNKLLFSKDEHLAIKYVLNKKYKNDKIEQIENPYVKKIDLLLKNGLAYGNKRNSIHQKYLPFDSYEKNLQYMYQKNMFFDKNEFKKLFLKKYPDGYDVIRNNTCTFDENKLKDILLIYKNFISLNEHVFKSSESYGRIFMPFQYISKYFRKAIRIGNNEKLFEVFDIHCCFISLTAKIFKKENQDDIDLQVECDKIIKLAFNDIYNDIINYNNLTEISTRDEIKTAVMQWLFSNNKDRLFFVSNSIGNIKYVDNYFQKKFLKFYLKVITYKMVYRKNWNGNNLKNKKISLLSIKCFELESNLMFNKVLPILHKTFDDIPFISLHDAIFISSNFKNKELEIKKTINKILKLI